MLFDYHQPDPRRRSFEQRLRRLIDLYQLLLNKLAADAERALQLLDQVARRHGLWGDGLDLPTFIKMLEKAKLIERAPGAPGTPGTPGNGGSFQLTPRGEQAMQRHALTELFGELTRNAGFGDHRSRLAGPGGEREPSVRPYTFGDELWNIAANETIHNAVKSSIGRGLDEIQVREDDLAVHETQLNTQCATALLIDCSHSMVLYGEDRMTPARTTAMGLIEFIKKNFPHDRLHVIAFGDDAIEVPLTQVPYLSWGPYHTNTKAALEMGRRILVRSRCPNKQIFMITDGKPTVLDEGGRRYIDSGWLNPRIVNRTLDEAAQCRRKQITITTFMVTEDAYLRQFVEQLTELNRGRAYYTGLGKLGQYLLVDYMKNRKKSVR